MAVDTDSQGNIIVVGYYNSRSANIAGETLADTGNYYNIPFVLKLSPTGELLWIRSFMAVVNPPFNNTPFTGAMFMSVKVDSFDNIVIAGELKATSLEIHGIQIVNETESGMLSNDMFVLKLNSDGNADWMKKPTGGGFEELGRLSIDVNDDIVVIGSSSSAVVNFGGETVTHPGFAPYNTVFLMKLSSQGVVNWMKMFGGNDYSDFGTDVATDGFGNIFISGNFTSTDFQVGGFLIHNSYTALDSTKQFDAFFAQLSPEGDPIWVRKLDTADGNFIEEARTILVDEYGCVYVAGSFSVTTYIGDVPLVNIEEDFSSPARDTFITKFSNSGTFIWAKTINDYGTNVPNSMNLDPERNLILGGDYRYGVEGLYLDGVNYPPNGNGFQTDPYLIKFESTAGDCEFLATNDIAITKSTIYPNPSSGLLNIINDKTIDNVKIYNTLGQLVYQQKWNNQPQNVQLQLNQLQAGNYIIIINGNETLKWLKK